MGGASLTALCVTLSLEICTSQFAHIAGYEPSTDVSQSLRIDLDLEEMGRHWSHFRPDLAWEVYTHGGHSIAYVELAIGPLAFDLVMGDGVKQEATGAIGTVRKDATRGSTTLRVMYGPSGSDCSLPLQSRGADLLCFQPWLPIIAKKSMINVSKVINIYQTLLGLSVDAGKQMHGLPYYDMYQSYYGRGDYANQLITSVLNGTGAFHPSTHASHPGLRAHAAKKAITLLTIWMHVIHAMDDAISHCVFQGNVGDRSECDGCSTEVSLHAWDKAVAFYFGSLWNTSWSGHLLYSVANDLCRHFGRTCKYGRSKVNTHLIDLFRDAQRQLMIGKCIEANKLRSRIVDLMSVPLIQGALQAGYAITSEKDVRRDRYNGAIFAAAILPRVAACSKSAAHTIKSNLNMDSPQPMSSGFDAIKHAFESTFPCMHIDCASVDGLLPEGISQGDLYADTYLKGAAPCRSSISNTDLLNTDGCNPCSQQRSWESTGNSLLHGDKLTHSNMRSTSRALWAPLLQILLGVVAICGSLLCCFPWCRRLVKPLRVQKLFHVSTIEDSMPGNNQRNEPIPSTFGKQDFTAVPTNWLPL